jgi:hypothetical protein
MSDSLLALTLCVGTGTVLRLGAADRWALVKKSLWNSSLNATW